MEGQTTKPGAADTGGLITLTAVVLGPKTPGMPPRIQDNEELLYVVEGRLLIQSGPDRAEIGPGRFLASPSGSRTPSLMPPSARRVPSQLATLTGWRRWSASWSST